MFRRLVQLLDAKKKVVPILVRTITETTETVLVYQAHCGAHVDPRMSQQRDVDGQKLFYRKE